jgi:nitrous oxidase accessory protein NosD
VTGDGSGYGGSAGYHAAGIHLDGIPPGGDVQIKGSLPRAARVVVGNARGVLVENCAGGIRLEKMALTSNAVGISLRNADGVLIQKNVVNDGRGSGTSVGIELDGNSDQNLMVKNTFVDAATDVMDGGTSNCWIGNTVGTGTVPAGGCGD